MLVDGVEAMVAFSHLTRATGGEPGNHGRITFRAQSTAISVRQVLQQIRDSLVSGGADKDLCNRVELVLAEALINVVEHAYVGAPDGCIQIVLDLSAKSVRVSLCDEGLPMPGYVLPEGRPQDLSVALADLPEGGFGWFLIRSLTQNLAYHRVDGRNHLSFALPVIEDQT